MTSARLEALLGSEGKRLGLLLLTTLLALLVLSAIARPAHAVSTFTVNQKGDQADANLADNVCDTNLATFPRGLQCTLRAAIQEANDTLNSGGPDLIRFNISGNGPHTISPTSELPSITEPVTIDGYTQGDLTTGTTADDAIENTLNKGTNAVLKIELNGENAGDANGFTITGGGTTIRGLVINRFNQLDAGTFDGCGIFLPNLAPNTNNVIEGNFIGTDVTGTQNLGNDLPGVLAFGLSTGNTIGGTTLASRNLVSGNGRDGVAINSGQNTVRGNLIGTDKGGTQNLGNGGSGVEVSDSNNFITNNTIAFNATDGVTIFFDFSTRNRILNNSIFNNTGLGIDLKDDGLTVNDAQDPDSGPNTLQNKPAIDSATTTGGSTTIEGRLNSTPDRTFTIQFFSNPSGNEGKKFIGQRSVTTNANGNTGTFTFNPAQAVAVGDTVTATATQAGNTSEFSAPKTVAAG